MPPQSDSSLEATDPHPLKGSIIFFKLRSKTFLTKLVFQILLLGSSEQKKIIKYKSTFLLLNMIKDLV